MSTESTNRAVLEHWYDHMWGKTDFDLIPDIAAAKYLRHDMTGANNLMPAEDYRDMLKPNIGHLEVQEFEYYLITEGDYVGALGRYILEGDRQWDWVQVFRLADGRLAETWLTGMGGTDALGYPHPRNAWTGEEFPEALPLNPAKQRVLDWYAFLFAPTDAARAEDFLAAEIRVHDQLDGDRRVTAAQYFDEMRTLMRSESASDFRHFLIEQDGVVFATCSCRLDDGRQWDWVQAFAIENERISRTWLPAIGGTDTALAIGPGTRWPPGAMPADSRRL
ncbi:hypothetical protein [Haliea sp. E17]|uniref:hypothetical protein n=1 Tax=Haliea sp. E17 TaxID=3401576 RepID=UPI003AAFD8FE